MNYEHVLKITSLPVKYFNLKNIEIIVRPVSLSSLFIYKQLNIKNKQKISW